MDDFSNLNLTHMLGKWGKKMYLDQRGKSENMLA